MRLRSIKNSALLLAFTASTLFANAQTFKIDWDKFSPNSKLGSNLSGDEVIKGLKEALSVGTNSSVNLVSRPDGFLKNMNIKIPFPPEAVKMESKLRALGMNKQVDKFIETLNRAAEDAAKEAAPIFLETIKQLTIKDGLAILRGADNAATNFLISSSSPLLKAKFMPSIKGALEKVSITSYWKPLVNVYSKIPGAKAVNPNLEEYVTQRALDGLFYMVAQEELKIRKDPLARGSEILKKVFGGK